MPVPDVKELLYSVIDGIGKEKIRMDVTADISASGRYIIQIVEGCLDRLGPGSGNEGEDDETLGTLCEALLHFMLTASLLPSERKTQAGGVEIDVVVPSIKSLAKDPGRSLVIQFIKGSGDLQRKIGLVQSSSIPPHGENIWAVSAAPLHAARTGFRNYCLKTEEKGGDCRHYSEIVSDIHKFLSERGVRNLRLLHG